jgi:hypothetical protein
MSQINPKRIISAGKSLRTIYKTIIISIISSVVILILSLLILANGNFNPKPIILLTALQSILTLVLFIIQMSKLYHLSEDFINCEIE